jgi:hypothetical protein
VLFIQSVDTDEQRIDEYPTDVEFSCEESCPELNTHERPSATEIVSLRDSKGPLNSGYMVDFLKR